MLCSQLFLIRIRTCDRQCTLKVVHPAGLIGVYTCLYTSQCWVHRYYEQRQMSRFSENTLWTSFFSRRNYEQNIIPETRDVCHRFCFLVPGIEPSNCHRLLRRSNERGNWASKTCTPLRESCKSVLKSTSCVQIVDCTPDLRPAKKIYETCHHFLRRNSAHYFFSRRNCEQNFFSENRDMFHRFCFPVLGIEPEISNNLLGCSNRRGYWGCITCTPLHESRKSVVKSTICVQNWNRLLHAVYLKNWASLRASSTWGRSVLSARHERKTILF